MGGCDYHRQLTAKIKLPSILGWLITGIVLGPYAFSLISDELIDMPVYQTTIHVLECAVGLMIGTELVWKKIRSYGKALIITTLTQSLGTFAVVSLVFTSQDNKGFQSHSCSLDDNRYTESRCAA